MGNVGFQMSWLSELDGLAQVEEESSKTSWTMTSPGWLFPVITSGFESWYGLEGERKNALE